MNRVIVRRAVGLGAPDDPDDRRRRFDTLRLSWQPELVDESLAQVGSPAGRRHQEIARLRPGRAPAGRREHVRPHVEHRQEIVAPAGVRHRDDHGLLGHVEVRDGIQRVEVRSNDDLDISGRIGRHVVEHVHRTATRFFAGFDVGELLARHVHRDERIEVDVGVDADGVRLLLGDGRWSALSKCRGGERDTEEKLQCQCNAASVHAWCGCHLMLRGRNQEHPKPDIDPCHAGFLIWSKRMYLGLGCRIAMDRQRGFMNTRPPNPARTSPRRCGRARIAPSRGRFAMRPQIRLEHLDPQTGQRPGYQRSPLPLSRAW